MPCVYSSNSNIYKHVVGHFFMSLSINIRAANEESIEDAIKKLQVVYPNLYFKGIVRGEDYYYTNILINAQAYPPVLSPKKPRSERYISSKIERDCLDYLKIRDVNNGRV